MFYLRYLDEFDEGIFIIRDGGNAGCEAVLSVRLQHEVAHFRIYKDEVSCNDYYVANYNKTLFLQKSKYFFYGIQRFFENIDALIDHYTQHFLFYNKYSFRLGSPLLV